MSKPIKVRCRCGKTRKLTPQKLVGLGWRKRSGFWHDDAARWKCDYCRQDEMWRVFGVRTATSP